MKTTYENLILWSRVVPVIHPFNVIIVIFYVWNFECVAQEVLLARELHER